MTDNQLQEFKDWLDSCPFEAYSNGEHISKQRGHTGWEAIHKVDVVVPD